MLDDAGRQGVRLLTFGELFLAPFFPNRLEEDFDRYFMRDDDPIVHGLRDKAKRACGSRWCCRWPSAPPPATSTRRSSSTRPGNEVGRYRKTHIPAYFPNAQAGGTGSYEKFYFTPGDSLDVYSVAGTRVGVQICNDRLYPEASRALALAGAELIAMPICFSTYSDPAHRASIWDVPLRARAYENGVFVLASNRVGIEGPRHHLGRSMVVDPRGIDRRARPAATSPSSWSPQIDLDDVSAARKKFPWWRDRRPDLYAPLADVG